MPLSRKKSCVRCRQSKLRCNQATPSCSRCSERGVRCLYDWKIGGAAPYANSTASKVSRTHLMPSRISEELIDGASQFENLDNTSALSASTFMNHELQAPDLSLDDFELDLTSMNAERSLGTPNLEPSLGATAESSTFPLRTDIPEYLEIGVPEPSAETLEMITCHLSDSEQWSLGRTISPNPASHVPQTLPVQLPPRRGTFQRRNMMIQGDRLPPFICPPCQLHEEMVFDCARSRKHQCLPKDLAICASLVQMFYSRTPQNADFVWKTIYVETDRLHREHENYDIYQQLAALQAITIYILLQALDVESVVLNNLYGIPARQQWVHEESVRRTMIILLIIDLLLEGLLEHQTVKCHSLRGAGLDNIPLPASRDLWEAETNFAWRNEYEKYLSQRKINKVLTIGDLMELTEGGALKTLLETDPRFDLVPDAYAWCESLDSLGSLLWMAIPFQQRRTRPGMNEVCGWSYGVAVVGKPMREVLALEDYAQIEVQYNEAYK
uniref:Sterigmatocystin biosynthesis regulatory protein n=1 Tax=Talaromyces marneffei PM1 TaxID=1077442 RepID=A0A093VQF5_TALMA